ncbi:hypothetical protein PsYK624_167310 [Phanerochaete sordida]|uniref:HAT C-terminal dimerisation domain-containing protein n=1 Tax=Phanerochaete sordida TaxID=48140 RepID=A0A9P3GRC1_9APHY|nr:hypothetical protein PsYK624_167310 [Phanerochaete sordida]
MSGEQQPTLSQLIQELKKLSLTLPDSVPVGKKTDKISIVLANVTGDDEFHTFNRKYDALFGMDCRDGPRLRYVRRGRYGMPAWCEYLEAIDLKHASIQPGLVRLRLTTLITELKTVISLARGRPAPTSEVADTLSSNPQNAQVASDAPPPPSGQQLAAQPAPVAQLLSGDRVEIPEIAENAKDQTVAKKRGKQLTKKTQLPLNLFLRGTASAVIELPSDGEANDKSYRPPKQRLEEPRSPSLILDSDGNEIIEDVSKARKKRRAAEMADIDEDEPSGDEYIAESSEEEGEDTLGSQPSDSEEEKRAARGKLKKGSKTSSTEKSRESGKSKSQKRQSSAKKYKRPPRKKAKTNKRSDVLVISSGDESDGQSALREVENADAAKVRRGGKRGPLNKTLQHFHTPVPVVCPDLKDKYRWDLKCKHCGKHRTVKRTLHGNGIQFEDEPKLPHLGNISGHLREDHPSLAAGDTLETDSKPDAPSGSSHGYTAASAKLMEAYLKEGELNPAVEPTQKGFLRIFAAWLLDQDLPFTTGEAPSLANLFKYLKIRFVLPSDTTVRNVLAEIFAELHGKVVRELSSIKSKIAYSSDSWTTRQMVFTFAGTIASFIDDDWDLIERLVDFHHLEDDEHKGQYAAKAFVNGAAKRGGLDKFVSITMDNASSNDVLARTLAALLLKRYGIQFSPENGQIRCIAHVVNLVVQQILHTLAEADDPALEDYYESYKHEPFHYDLEDDDEQKALEQELLDMFEEGDAGLDDEGELEDEDVDAELGDLGQSKWSQQGAVKKLRLLCTKITSSPQRRSAFHRVKQRVYKADTAENTRRRRLMVIRDVVTRWNYTHAMIVRALELKEAINAWVSAHPALDELRISPKDWKLLGQLAQLLSIFTEVTKAMSRAHTPTLPFVLPMYESMNKQLSASAADTKIDPLIRNAAAAGLQKLTGYFAKAKASQYIVVATILHPALRIGWCNTLGDDFAKKARVLFEHVYEEYSAATAPDPAAKPAPSKASDAAISGSFLDAICAIPELPHTPAVETAEKSEIERYFAGEGKHIKPDGALILPWWREHAGAFPVISRMARDFLCIPATSVSVERLFSAGRHLCTDLRSSFRAQTVTEAMCVKQWIRAGLLDPEPPANRRSKKM